VGTATSQPSVVREFAYRHCAVLADVLCHVVFHAVGQAALDGDNFWRVLAAGLAGGLI